jgi:hypothetical protein
MIYLSGDSHTIWNKLAHHLELYLRLAPARRLAPCLRFAPFTTTLKMFWHVYLGSYIVVGTLVSLNESMRITTPSTTFTRMPLIPVVKAVSIFMMVQFVGSV